MDATVAINAANHARSAMTEFKVVTVVARNLPQLVIVVLATEAPIATAAPTTGIIARTHALPHATIAQIAVIREPRTVTTVLIAGTHVQLTAIIAAIRGSQPVTIAGIRGPQPGITVQTAATRAHTTATIVLIAGTIAQTDVIIARIGVITGIIIAATTAITIHTRGHT